MKRRWLFASLIPISAIAAIVGVSEAIKSSECKKIGPYHDRVGRLVNEIASNMESRDVSKLLSISAELESLTPSLVKSRYWDSDVKRINLALIKSINRNANFARHVANPSDLYHGAGGMGDLGFDYELSCKMKIPDRWVFLHRMSVPN